MDLKVGDKVRVKTGYNYHGEGSLATIVSTGITGYSEPCVEYTVEGETISYTGFVSKLELIKQGNNNMANMTLVQKMKLALKSEPEKTFQKVGITDEKDELTADGTVLFHNWLFEKNKAEFNTEVAQPLLVEQEKESK